MTVQEALADFHIISFIITWISSRYGTHSRVHMYIAELAIAAEVIGMYASLAWFVGWNWTRWLVYGATAAVIVCMVAVVLTDGWWMRILGKIVRFLREVIHAF